MTEIISALKKLSRANARSLEKFRVSFERKDVVSDVEERSEASGPNSTTTKAPSEVTNRSIITVSEDDVRSSTEDDPLVPILPELHDTTSSIRTRASTDSPAKEDDSGEISETALDSKLAEKAVVAVGTSDYYSHESQTGSGSAGPPETTGTRPDEKSEDRLEKHGPEVQAHVREAIKSVIASSPDVQAHTSQEPEEVVTGETTESPPTVNLHEEEVQQDDTKARVQTEVWVAESTDTPDESTDGDSESEDELDPDSGESSGSPENLDNSESLNDTAIYGPEDNTDRDAHEEAGIMPAIPELPSGSKSE